MDDRNDGRHERSGALPENWEYSVGMYPRPVADVDSSLKGGAIQIVKHVEVASPLVSMFGTTR
jgi:hypothetical protein